MTTFTLPHDYPRVRQAISFQELVTTPFRNGINAVCWPRVLDGDFEEVIRQLSMRDELVTLDERQLLALPVSSAGTAAVRVLVEDLNLLRELELDPVLNAIITYPRDEDGPVATDVYSFHVDSAPIEADTWLCTYHGAPSEGLRNDQARRRVDVPEIRAELLKTFGGEDDESFLDYLNENCYDLHYAPLPLAQPFSFGIGNLWRIAVDYPGSPVPPCIHRAPATLPNEAPRLLLIS